MPLKYDPEWQEELDKVISQTKVKSPGPFPFVGALGLMYAAVLVLLVKAGASEIYYLPIILIIGVLSIAWILVREARALHITLAVLIATVEWTSRKQLGDDEPG